MKMSARFSYLKTPERHGLSMPAAILMCFRTMLAASAMLTSVAQGNAFTCFSSAEAVRQQNATAWPSWTLRAPGHEGAKCWYPATRATAQDHRNVSMPRTDRPDGNERFERDARTTGSATSDTVRFPSPVLESSFDDRFSAICTADGSKARYTVRDPWCGPVRDSESGGRP
jgi:hypothetical protein